MRTNIYFVALMAAACLVFFNSCSKTEVVIEAAVQIANKQCPQDMGSGLTLTKVENESNYVVYNIEGDDEIYSYSQDLVTDELKEQMISMLQTQSLANSDGAKFIQALKEAHKGVIYHYYTSDTSMDIVIEANEL